MDERGIEINSLLKILEGMSIDWVACVIAAVSTLLVGYLWYHPRAFGAVWMSQADITEERMAGMNTGVAFAAAVVMAFFSALLMYIIVHADSPSSDTDAMVGVILWAFMVVPVLVITSLVDNKGWQYILVNGGYWLVCFAMMGVIVTFW